MENLKSILQIVLWISIPVFVLAALVTVILHYRRKRKLLDESELDLPDVESPGEFTSQTTIPIPTDSGDSSRLIRQYSAKLEAADSIIAGLKGKYAALEKRYTQVMQTKSSSDEGELSVDQLQHDLFIYRSQLKDLRAAYEELEKEEEAQASRIAALQSELESVPRKQHAESEEERQLAKRLEDAEKAIAALGENHAAKLAEKDAELQVLRSEQERMQKELDEKQQQQVSEGEERTLQFTEFFRQQLDDKDKELQQLRDQKNRLQKDIGTVRTELQQHHLAQLGALRDQLRQEYLEQIEIKDVSIDALEQSRNQLQKELEESRNRQQENLRRNGAAVTQEIEQQYLRQLSEKDAANQQLQRQAADLREKVDSFYYIEDLMKEKAQQIAFFENQIAQRVRQVHETEKHYQDALNRLQQSEERNNAHAARISELQSSLAELKRRSEEIELAKKEKESALLQLDALVNEKIAYTATLENSLQEQQANNQQLQTELQEHRQKNSDYQKRLQELEGKLKISSNVLARIYSDLGKSFASIFTEDEHHQLEDKTVEFIELNGNSQNGESVSANGHQPFAEQSSEKV